MKLGYYDKYDVKKSDGSELKPDSQYFVLKLNSQKDKAVVPAILTYIDEVKKYNNILSSELKQVVGERFIDDGDFLIDRKTNIKWYKRPSISGELSYLDAIEYCNNFGDGFRIPTIEEFISILDFSKRKPAIAIESYLIDELIIGYYWAVSNFVKSDKFHLSNFYNVNVRAGEILTAIRTDYNYVWMVKDM